MKSTIIVSLAMLAIIAFAGCKKNNESQPKCRVSVLTVNGSSDNRFYYYDNLGRLETTRYGNYFTNYVYHGDSIAVTQTLSGTVTYSGFIKMNAKGLPLLALKVFGPRQFRREFEYNGSEVKKQTYLDSFFGTPQVFTYTWSNGNLTNYTDGKTVYSYEYYTDKPYREGDANHIESILDSNLEFIRNKNMVKQMHALSSSSSSTTYFDYTYDSVGKVTSMTRTGIFSYAYGLQYQCN